MNASAQATATGTTPDNLLYALAYAWEKGEVTCGHVEWEDLEPLLNSASAYFGTARMRNHVRGFTAASLQRALITIKVDLPLDPGTTDADLGRGADETRDQWLTRIEHEGPDAVYDFLDRLTQALQTGFVLGIMDDSPEDQHADDYTIKRALVGVLASSHPEKPTTIREAIQHGYHERI